MAFDNKGYGEGSVSEWNEGNFKNLRLHEAQEMINEGKINPFEMNPEKTKWNYQIWKGGIDILYGEGQSKYSDEEVDEVEKIKKLIELYLDIKSPFRKITEHDVGGNKDSYVPLKDNQQKIKDVLEIYEKLVKKFNDIHGLSTRNMDTYDEDEI